MCFPLEKRYFSMTCLLLPSVLWCRSTFSHSAIHRRHSEGISLKSICMYIPRTINSTEVTVCTFINTDQLSSVKV